jgi:tRNA-dihydrouridine synthase
LFAGTGDDPAADPARQRAARLDGAAAFAITRVPPIPDNFGPGGEQSAQLAALVRSVRWVTLAARPEGDDLRVALEGECDNGEDARQLQSALEVLRMFGRAALDNPKTKQQMDPAMNSVLQNLLQNADVTESGERVRVLLELTPDVFSLGGNHQSK